MKHTQGVWKVVEQGDADEFCIMTEDKRWIFAFRQNGELWTEEQRANAKLIAAAPDMLEACMEAKRMYEELEPAGGWQGVFDQLAYAIRKATE